MKKTLSILLIAIMLLSLFAVIPFSAGALTEGDWEFRELEDGTLETAKYNGPDGGTITVPSQAGGKTVTSLGSYTFGAVSVLYRNVECDTLVLPDSITNLGANAFVKIDFKHITLPNHIKTLTYFGRKSLEEITIPNSVTTIPDEAFEACSKLKSVKLSTNCNELRYGLFQRCTALETITIPANVTGIGSFAFDGCTALKSVVFGNVKNGLSIGTGTFRGCIALKSIDLPDGLTDIGDRAFLGCTKLGSITLPDTVTDCDYSAFEGCTALKSVSLSAAMKEVETACFKDCTALISITFPASIETVHSEAFMGCTALTAATWKGSDAWMIGERSFMGCSKLAKVTLPENEMYSIADAFINCPKLTSVRTPKTVTADIYEHAFGYTYNSTTEEYTPMAGFTVYGYTGSKGETYAKINNFKFVSVDPVNTPKITKKENTASGVKLTIGKVTGAKKYRVFVKNSGKWKVLGDTTSTAYVHKAAKSGVQYTYTVRCVTADGKEFVSKYNTKGWTITFIAQPALPALKNTKAGVQLTLKKVTGAAQYRIFRKQGSGKWSKLADTKSLKYIDRKAKNGVTYRYTVRCLSKDGKSFTSSYNTVGAKIKCKR